MMRVYVCSMSRSGGTLLYQMLKLALELRDIGTGVGFPVGSTNVPEHHRFAVYKSELCRQWMQAAVKSGAGIAIGTYRDPRDVAASLLRFYIARQTIKDLIDDPDPDDVWDNLAFPALVDAIEWYKQWEWLPIYHTKYEIVHPTGWPRFLQGVGIQLGIDITAAEAKACYCQFSIGKNVQRQKDMENWISPSTLLTKDHVSQNRGRSGTFADWLTPAQVAQVVDASAVWMSLHGYILEETP